MKKVNVVYEYEYDHVDIILVPDAIAENIQSVVNDFLSGYPMMNTQNVL